MFIEYGQVFLGMLSLPKLWHLSCLHAHADAMASFSNRKATGVDVYWIICPILCCVEDTTGPQVIPSHSFFSSSSDWPGRQHSNRCLWGALVCWNRSGADETEPMGGTTNSIQLLHLAVQGTHTQLRLVIILCSIMVEMFKVLIS